MNVDITIKNYRCFEDINPPKIELRDGFTALVGPNNAGKTCLLRLFYELRNLFQDLSQPGGSMRAALRGQPQAFSFQPEILDQNEIFCKFNERDISLIFEIALPDDGPDGTLNPRQLTVTVPRGTNTWLLSVATSAGKLEGPPDIELSGLVVSSGEMKADLSHYIEIFRRLSRTLYVPSFRNPINLGANDRYYDIQTGQAFITAWRELKSGNNARDNEAADEITELMRDIFGYERLEITSSADSRSMRVPINGRSYGLHELGSGFAQFMLAHVNAATVRPALVLIDEPELNLHATLQLRFLTSLGSFAENGVLFATHSMGLARAASERIYSFTRAIDQGSEVKELGRTPLLPEFLGELSFSSYQELGYEGIILVEGPTEIKVLHELLRKYGKDPGFVVIHMGGDSLIREGVETELCEIRRISENIFAVIDSEKTSAEAPLSSTRSGFVDVCRRVGIKCWVLERRAMENYFTDRALKKVLGPKYSELGHFERLNEAELSWNKAENWRIVREMTREELDVTDLGEFIKSTG